MVAYYAQRKTIGSQSRRAETRGGGKQRREDTRKDDRRN